METSFIIVSYKNTHVCYTFSGNLPYKSIKKKHLQNRHNFRAGGGGGEGH